SLAPFPITPERAKWSVSMPQPIPIMGKVVYAHMKAHNVKTVGYIGYSDSYGDLWFNDFKAQGVPMGLIYQTHGAASMDFIRIAGKAAEGVLMASGPVMDPEDQPDSALTKKPGLALDKAYEAKYGANSRSQFAGHSYDAFLVLERVVPVALKKAKPGTPEFREAIRQALMSEHDIAASQGVYNFTEKDRYGLDHRSRILLTVK